VPAQSIELGGDAAAEAILVPMESERGLSILDLLRFLNSNRYPLRSKML
jgi:hypothetical protein